MYNLSFDDVVPLFATRWCHCLGKLRGLGSQTIRRLDLSNLVLNVVLSSKREINQEINQQ